MSSVGPMVALKEKKPASCKINIRFKFISMWRVRDLVDYLRGHGNEGRVDGREEIWSEFSSCESIVLVYVCPHFAQGVEITQI